MNHTKNYNLPQWELNDLIRMEDFNGAMASIETGLNAAEQRDNSLSNRVDAARAMAEQPPYAMGLYAGSGDTAQEITVGFRPSFLLIFTNQTADDPTLTIARFCAVSADVNTRKVKFTETGFRVAADTSNKYPYVNYKGMLFQYIAFK